MDRTGSTNISYFLSYYLQSPNTGIEVSIRVLPV